MATTRSRYGVAALLDCNEAEIEASATVPPRPTCGVSQRMR